MNDHDPLCRQQHWDGGDCFDCRLIAKVRADERSYSRTAAGVRRDAEAKWADLRARVEALPTTVIEPMATLYVRRASVLALFGSSDA